MSKILRNLIASILACIIMLSLMPAVFAEASAPEPAYFDLPVTIDTVKVGLHSSSGGFREVCLENKIGSGFKLGYFDYSRHFHTLGSSDVTSLSLRGDNGFTLADGMAVGPWHMILNERFSDFKSAKSYAKTLWGGFPAYINGEYRVMVGAYADESSANSQIAKRNLDAAAFTGSDYSILAAQTGTSELQFMLDNGENTKLAVKPSSESGKAETWFSGDAYYGCFEITRKDIGITVINYVDLEDYVKGVLPYEAHGDWPEATLKAQGACARTYVINKIDSYIDRGFDVRDDTYSQVYRGTTGTTESTNIAAEETAGEYIRFRGSVCKVYYMSSDGGATDSGANIFSEKRAYLQGVKDNNEKNIDFYNKTWKTELKDENVLYRLRDNGSELKDIKSIKAVKSDLDNVIELKFKDSEGKSVTLYGEECFRVMGLNSINFTLSSYENAQKERVWVFDGKGWGHNCGMSQWGAYGMALDENVKCGDIINFYFSGAYMR